MPKKNAKATLFSQIIIGIYDRKAEAFTEMAAIANEGVARRGFQEVINKASDSNNLYKWPGDYELWQLGYYNPGSGDLIAQKIKLVSGDEVKVRD